MQRSRSLDASFLVKKLSQNFYAIPTKMTKSLTDPRTAYEYFLGKRVSDNHWRSFAELLQKWHDGKR
jgi:hypothetical protein